MRALLLAVVVVFVGCSKKSAPEVVDAGIPVAVKKPRELLNSPSTLSVFTAAETQCVWSQQDHVANKRTDLASFPGNCVGVRVAWSLDTMKAVVSFDPQLVQVAGYSSTVSSPPGFADEKVDDTAKPRWFLVDVKTGEVETLTVPSVDKNEVRELAILKTGEVVAFLEETLPEGAKGTIKSGDQTFDLSEITEGIPVLVHAYKREGTSWKRFETKLSTTGWDYGAGVQMLDAATDIGVKSDLFLTSRSETDIVDEERLKKVKKFTPSKAKTDDDGEWTGIEFGEHVAFIWQVSGEFAHTTGLVIANDAKLPQSEFTDGDLAAIRSNGSYLLITKSDVGTHPRLYSFPEVKLVFRSDEARGVTFWPAPIQTK